jgi:3-isopropylmalate dehydrogenase
MAQSTRGVAGVRRWSDCLNLHRPSDRNSNRLLPIGVLRGEGIGPEVMGAAVDVLYLLGAHIGQPIEIFEFGRVDGRSKPMLSAPLPHDLFHFCEDIFKRGGHILQGPMSGRFVYNLRKRFDLFLKISPIRLNYSIPQASTFQNASFDILVTRENSGGVYQGGWDQEIGPSGGRLARHHFSYSEDQISRFLHASARLAKQRRGKLSVIWKEFGLPSISSLWRDCAEEAAKAHAVKLQMIEIDLMAYLLVRKPQDFDVIAAPNLFGDLLSDVGAALLGSRGISFSGNFNEVGNAVYQTNHGAASDIAMMDRANPAGQIFTLAMMLRESFGLDREATAIEEAIRAVWNEGWRTEDVAMPGTRIVGTREMGRRIGERAVKMLKSPERLSGASVGNEAASHTG